LVIEKLSCASELFTKQANIQVIENSKADILALVFIQEVLVRLSKDKVYFD